MGAGQSRPFVLRGRPSLKYLGFGAVWIALFYAVDVLALRDVIYVLIPASAATAVFIGVAAHRPANRVPWYLMAVGFCLSAAGNVLYFTYEILLHSIPPFPGLADALFIGTYVFLILGIFTLLRGAGREHLGDLVDALIITLGIALVTWVLLMAPYVENSRQGIAIRAVALSYPILALGLIVCGLRLWFLVDHHVRAARYLVACLALFGGGLLAWGLVFLHAAYYTGSPVDFPFLVGMITLGACALDPSMTGIVAVGTAPKQTVVQKRFVFFGISLLTGPFALWLRGSGLTPLDRTVVMGLTLAIVCLVVVRLAGLLSAVRATVDELEQSSESLRTALGGLSAAELKYRTLVEHLPAIVYTATMADPGDWTYVSPQAERILGFPVERWTTDPNLWINQLHPEDRERAENDAEEAWFGGALTYTSEYRMLAADGRVVWLRDEAILDRDENGRPLAFQGVMLDVTVEKELEKGLEQGQKMEAIGQLAGGVAHDFNNLLSVILNYARFVAEDLEPDDPRRDDVEEIYKAGKRAGDLVSRLLAFSRSEVLQPQILSVDEVIIDLQKMLLRTIKESIEVEVHLGAGTRHVVIDKGQLEQVLVNLAVNAKDAMPSGGNLTIRTEEMHMPSGPDGRAPDDFVCLTVSDTGAGMEPEVVERIFDPFFTTKERGQGTGLGLSIVYGVVEAAGGFIDVDSRPGAGTAFRVHLPSCDEAAPAVVPQALLQSRIAEGTILVAEDEKGVRVIVDRILSRAGYEVLTSHSGSAAIELAAGYAGPIHLLITDVVMPGMSGKELVERMASQRPEICVLYMSGYTDQIIAAQGRLEDGEAFIQKPFASEELLDKVTKLLAAEPGTVSREAS